MSINQFPKSDFQELLDDSFQMDVPTFQRELNNLFLTKIKNNHVPIESISIISQITINYFINIQQMKFDCFDFPKERVSVLMDFYKRTIHYNLPNFPKDNLILFIKGSIRSFMVRRNRHSFPYYMVNSFLSAFDFIKEELTEQELQIQVNSITLIMNSPADCIDWLKNANNLNLVYLESEMYFQKCIEDFTMTKREDLIKEFIKLLAIRKIPLSYFDYQHVINKINGISNQIRMILLNQMKDSFNLTTIIYKDKKFIKSKTIEYNYEDRENTNKQFCIDLIDTFSDITNELDLKDFTLYYFCNYNKKLGKLINDNLFNSNFCKILKTIQPLNLDSCKALNFLLSIKNYWEPSNCNYLDNDLRFSGKELQLLITELDFIYNENRILILLKDLFERTDCTNLAIIEIINMLQKIQIYNKDNTILWIKKPKSLLELNDFLLRNIEILSKLNFPLGQDRLNLSMKQAQLNLINGTSFQLEVPLYRFDLIKAGQLLNNCIGNGFYEECILLTKNFIFFITLIEGNSHKYIYCVQTDLFYNIIEIKGKNNTIVCHQDYKLIQEHLIKLKNMA